MAILKLSANVVSLFLPGLVFAGCGLLNAQTPVHGSGPGGSVRMVSTDWAILETQEPRKDLPCTVTPIKPIVGFDLRFHSGYEVTVPLKELAGSDNLLTMLFRVAPQDHRDEPSYFVQRVRVPSIEADASGMPSYKGFSTWGRAAITWTGLCATVPNACVPLTGIRMRNWRPRTSNWR